MQTSQDFLRESKRWHKKWIKEPQHGPMLWDAKQLKLVPKRIETESEFRRRRKNSNLVMGLEESSSDDSSTKSPSPRKSLEQSLIDDS